MIYDLLFVPYNGLDKTSPYILLERMVFAQLPRKFELGWLLVEEGKAPRTAGFMLIVPTGSEGPPEKEYWYTPTRNIKLFPPLPLPHTYPQPLPHRLSDEISVGERGYNRSGERLREPEHHRKTVYTCYTSERKRSGNITDRSILAATIIWGVKAGIDVKRWVKSKRSRKE